jgi:hypothetical protein
MYDGAMQTTVALLRKVAFVSKLPKRHASVLTFTKPVPRTTSGVKAPSIAIAGATLLTTGGLANVNVPAVVFAKPITVRESETVAC